MKRNVRLRIAGFSLLWEKSYFTLISLYDVSQMSRLAIH